MARLTDFGAFVTLEPGIDGLIHVSEAAPQRIEHVREVLQPGQTVEAVVLGVDAEKKRVSLSLKRAAEGVGDAAPGRRPRRASRREPERGARRGRPGAAPAASPSAAPAARPSAGEQGSGASRRGHAAEPELTTMAIALRAAMERAKKKQQEGDGGS